MTTTARFRYVSDDLSPVTLPGNLGAVPSIVEPGDVFEVVLDETTPATTLDDQGRSVASNAAELALESLDADDRFERVSDDEPTSEPRPSDGLTAAVLRERLLTFDGAPERLPRRRDELAALYDDLAPPPPPSDPDVVDQNPEG